jgi:hypothetical protein
MVYCCVAAVVPHLPGDFVVCPIAIIESDYVHAWWRWIEMGRWWLWVVWKMTATVKMPRDSMNSYVHLPPGILQETMQDPALRLQEGSHRNSYQYYAVPHFMCRHPPLCTSLCNSAHCRSCVLEIAVWVQNSTFCFSCKYCCYCNANYRYSLKFSVL